MRKASAIIHAILKKYPLNEEIAENYVLSLDFLCEDYQDENEITIYNLIFSDVKIFGSAIYLIKISVIFRPPNTIVSVQFKDRFIAN